MMKYISDTFLPIIDFFLSPANRASAELRMRARMLVFFSIFYAFLTGLGLLTLSQMVGWLEYRLMWASFLTNVAILILIRRSYTPDKILIVAAIAYLFVLVLGIEYSTFLNSNYMNGLIVVTWMSCLIANDLRIRIAAMAMIFMATSIALLSIANKPDIYFLEYPPGVDAAVLANLLVNVFAQLVIFSMCLRIKAIAQDDLDREIEWQQRLRILEELASTTTTMRHLFLRPLGSIRLDLASLKQAADAFAFERMQKALDELVMISQCYSWLYRAHGSAGKYSVLSSTLLRQLEALLSSKMEEESWTLDVKHSGKPVEIYGPVPSIVLVLFTLIVQILEEPLPHENRLLSLEFLHLGKNTIWKLRWPYDSIISDSARNNPYGIRLPRAVVKNEMIQDLTRACNARVWHSQDEGTQEIQLSGSWHRVKP